ncbi:MAG: bifunctional glycosyltransferase family 2/GtrA family protein [Clostridia bacterium]|nr:bifunctional glycosyltransferase family 2/GtrA family protein [Clostridia bacterium]
MNVTAIVPSLNPDEKFLRVVEGLVEAGFDSIILVDDGSRPDCRVWFERAMEYPQCTLLRHGKNLGKGRALKTAFNHFLSLENGHVGVVTLDGDGQHAMPDVVNCAKALEEHPESLILGARVFSGDHVPFRSRMGNNITSFIFKALCGIPVSDTQTGLRGISAEFCRYLLDVKGERFEFETNMLLETRRAEVTIREVPIETVYIEENKSSHFRVIRDSVAIYGLILKYLSSSILSFVLDWGLFTLFLWILGNIAGNLEEINIWIATAGARILSSLFNFTMNRTVVFRSREGLGKTMTRYYVLCICQLLASAGLVHLLSLTGCPSAVAKIPVDILLFCISFRIQRNWVFRK